MRRDYLFFVLITVFLVLLASGVVLGDLGDIAFNGRTL
jgi:hypothetical protein